MSNVIKFRRLYERLQEGYSPNAIVSYWKTDWWTNGSEITQWIHNLIIDLWLVQVKFRWFTGYTTEATDVIEGSMVPSEPQTPAKASPRGTRGTK